MPDLPRPCRGGLLDLLQVEVQEVVGSLEPTAKRPVPQLDDDELARRTEEEVAGRGQLQLRRELTTAMTNPRAIPTAPSIVT